jgi:hypothetical protein
MEEPAGNVGCLSGPFDVDNSLMDVAYAAFFGSATNRTPIASSIAEAMRENARACNR